jgi:phenylpyruvate tautomerase PptA (4-oxalocrotonate tautomerase family)
MLDLTKIPRRYFEIKLKDERIINVECPKLKVFRKIIEITEGGKDTIEELSEALAMALNKNKEGVKITSDYIEDSFDYDDIVEVLTQYFDWVKNLKSLPNL